MFHPGCLPILIGSLPVEDHEEATRIILSHTPEIPLWPQLPRLPKEGMIRQFLTGFPGLVEEEDRYWIDTGRKRFEEEMAAFYEEYMRVEEDAALLGESRFALGHDTARGFFTLMKALETVSPPPLTQDTLPTVWIENNIDYLKALKIKEEYESNGSMPHASKENWICPDCREEHERQFTACWNCGRERAE